jgi:hypothetical protein
LSYFKFEEVIMYRRYRERYRERRHRRRNYDDRPRHGLTSFFRSPRAQIAVLLIVTLVIAFILLSAGR